MVAAVREAGDTSVGMPISGRRNTMSKSGSARSAALGSLPSPPASLPGHRFRLSANGKMDRSESAIEDDQLDEMDDDEEKDDEEEDDKGSRGGKPRQSRKRRRRKQSGR